MQLAEKGHLVTFGTPTGPGNRVWIHSNQPANYLEAKKDGRPQVTRLPDLSVPSRTKAAVSQKWQLHWNSGMFLWKAATIRDEINRHQPQLAKAVQKVHPDDIGRRSPAD